MLENLLINLKLRMLKNNFLNKNQKKKMLKNLEKNNHIQVFQINCHNHQMKFLKMT